MIFKIMRFCNIKFSLIGVLKKPVFVLKKHNYFLYFPCCKFNVKQNNTYYVMKLRKILYEVLIIIIIKNSYPYVLGF